ncbi:MAG: hypothetical protein HY649_00415 [Acidobacteria bacterium]|nr:hypothetical protein [Acidobacteriota bacterium]
MIHFEEAGFILDTDHNSTGLADARPELPVALLTMEDALMKLILIGDEGEVIWSFDDIEKHHATSAQGVLALLDIVESMTKAAKSNNTVSRLGRSVGKPLAQNSSES